MPTVKDSLKQSFLGSPKPIRYGYNQDIVSTIYLTPIVGVIIGEVIARLFNEIVVRLSVKSNNGVLESESTLISTIPGTIIYAAGMVLLGWTMEHKANIVGVIFGWGMVQVGTVFTVVAMLAYTSANFPGREGECSALLSWGRVLAGFSVRYFQVTWVSNNGALQAYGVEGAVIVALWLICIPFFFWKGKQVREIFSIKGRDCVLITPHSAYIPVEEGAAQHPRNVGRDNARRIGGQTYEFGDARWILIRPRKGFV